MPMLNVAHHLGLLDVSDLLQMFKDGQDGPAPISTSAATPLGSTRGRFSVMPPPVIWAMALTASASTMRRTMGQ